MRFHKKAAKQRVRFSYKELIPFLKVNTGFGLFEATSMKEVRKVTLELGIANTTCQTKYKQFMMVGGVERENEDNLSSPEFLVS